MESYLYFQLALLNSVSYFFFLYWSPSSSLCTVFDSVSPEIDEVLSINPSANVFLFGDFNILHKDCLAYSGRTDRLGKLCYNFSISNDLTQMVTFLSLIVTLKILLFWIYLFFLMLVFAPHWEVLIMLLSLFRLTFPHTLNGMPHFIA